MSKPSSKPVHKRKRSKPVVKTGLKLVKAPDDEARAEFRDLMIGLLTELRQCGKAVDVMVRQQYNPEGMLNVLEHFLTVFTTMATATQVTGAMAAPVADGAQKAVSNAAAILLFFQGPVLSGIFEEQAPMDVLKEFITVVNKLAGEAAPSELEKESNHAEETKDPSADHPEATSAD